MQSADFGDFDHHSQIGVALPFTKIFTLRVTKMYPCHVIAVRVVTSIMLDSDRDTSSANVAE